MEDVVLLLHHLHTHFGHFGGQQRGGFADAVLYVDRRQVRVGALLEIHLYRYVTRGGSRRGDIGHVGHTVDALFERLHHGFHDGVGIGTGVRGRYTHRRRGDVRVLLNRQGGDGDESHQRDNNRYRACHHVFIDKNVTFHKNIY